jgi:3-dehydroquinate synthase
MVAGFVNSERVRGCAVFLFRLCKNQYRFGVIAIQVQAAKHSYRVLIGSGILGATAGAVKDVLSPAACAVISDTNVAPRFGDQLQRSLIAAGYEPRLLTVPAGEESKTLERAGDICEQMLSAGLNRQSFVIGLGGGVIGDLSGFVAAIFERGIPHVQVPTTLLAMVDSSIGGKTGVNTGAGKNLIGAFHPPVLVLDDVEVLRKLPRRELNQGFAEIIKHSIIADAKMFRQLEDVDPEKVDFAPLIRENIATKARIVKKDEFERKGERALLNFGHTIGHAIERAAEYRDLVHGEAVSLGIVAASELSMKKAGLPKKDRDRIVDLLRRFGLPIQLRKDFPREKIFDALKFDKKFVRGEVRFVVTTKIGSAELASDVTMDDLRAAVEML